MTSMWVALVCEALVLSAIVGGITTVLRQRLRMTAGEAATETADS